MNNFTKENYQGKNAIITSSSGYDINLWAGFVQWKVNGYKVKKGSKGTKIQIVFKKKNGDKCIAYKSIFNIDQVEEIKAKI